MMNSADAKRYESCARKAKGDEAISWWTVAAEAWRQAGNEREALRCEEEMVKCASNENTDVV